MRRLPRLDALGPGPTPQSLTFGVPCSTRPDLSSATEHSVSLQPDWTLHTPHDLEAERVAAAFGGYCSCLVLADKVTPAVQALLQARARRVPLSLSRGTRGAWTVRSPHKAPCCRPEHRASDAAGHLRTVEHAARAAGAPVVLVRAVTNAVLRAHRADPPWLLTDDDLHDLRRCVRSESGPVQVWDAGLHPTVVAYVHDEAVGEDGPPLPVALYLGVLSRRPDLAWLAETLAAVDGGRTDPSLAEWLAWTQTPLDRRERQARTGWLLSGAPRAWISELSGAGYRPDDAIRLSRATGRSLVGVADMLMAWVSSGCRPSVDDLLRLDAEGVPAWYRPSAPAITRLRSELGSDGEPLSHTDLGLLIAREGTVPAAAARARATLTGRLGVPTTTTTRQRSCA